jgi:hypothetical protein
MTAISKGRGGPRDGAGRKPKAAGGVMYTILGVRIDTATKRKLVALAARKNTSVADLLRPLIEALLAGVV